MPIKKYDNLIVTQNIKLFIKFLRYHDVERNFFNNYHNRSKNFKRYFLFDEDIIGDYICCAFDWGTSPEGFNFWNTLDDLWHDHLYNLDWFK